jgi:acyl dehydratase
LAHRSVDDELLVASEIRPAGGLIGAGGEEIRWPLPTRPGDVPSCTTEILETRPSAKRPTQGLVKVRITTANAAGQAVQVLVMNMVVQRRPTDAA